VVGSGEAFALPCRPPVLSMSVLVPPGAYRKPIVARRLPSSVRRRRCPRWWNCRLNGARNGSEGVEGEGGCPKNNVPCSARLASDSVAPSSNEGPEARVPGGPAGVSVVPADHSATVAALAVESWCPTRGVRCVVGAVCVRGMF